MYIWCLVVILSISNIFLVFFDFKIELKTLKTNFFFFSSFLQNTKNRNKKAANLVWNAPLNIGNVNQGGLSGQVVFRGTVVRKYDTFFKGLISVVNPHVHV